MEALEELDDLLKENHEQGKKPIQLSCQLPLESIFPQPILSSPLSPTEQKIYLQLAIEFQIILKNTFSYQEGLYRWNLILDDRLQCYGLIREVWEHIAAQGDQDRLLQLLLHRLLQKITSVLKRSRLVEKSGRSMQNERITSDKRDRLRKVDTLEAIEAEKISRGAKCWWCGSSFYTGSIWCDSNRYGMKVAGFREKQIIFFHCHNCGKNTSLNRCTIQQTGRYKDYFESTLN